MFLWYKNCCTGVCMEGISLSSSQGQLNNKIDSVSNDFKTQEGIFKYENINVSINVDPSTKDDEVASTFQAEKNTKKAQKKKDKEGNKAKLNALQKAKENQNINEQDQRSRRISKATEKRLASLGQFTSKDLSGTIQERSQKLFDGNEKNYQECFEELDLAVRQKTLTPDKIAQATKRFDDVAEQHNALQITIEVLERKLSNLKKLKQGVSSEKDIDAQTKQQDQEEIQKQIQELENALDGIKKSQGDLMNLKEARDHIIGSYETAPLLRKITASIVNDITLNPKSYNALLLDKLLPLKGDPAKTFDCLTQGLIDGVDLPVSTSIEHFNNNLGVFKSCLSQELKCCPDKNTSAAILNTIRSIEKFDTVQKLDVQLITKLSSVVPFETPTSEIETPTSPAA